MLLVSKIAEESSRGRTSTHAWLRQEAARKDPSSPLPPPVVMAPIVEWWVENFSLISDIVTRRYPFYMVAYDSVLDAPEETLRAVFRWLGEGDAEAAIQKVEPALRTQDRDSRNEAREEADSLEPEVVEVFDALYELVLKQAPLEQAFVDRLNQTNEALGPRIEEAVKAVEAARLERKRFMEARRKPGID
jgi:hypothetical protein